MDCNRCSRAHSVDNSNSLLVVPQFTLFITFINDQLWRNISLDQIESISYLRTLYSIEIRQLDIHGYVFEVIDLKFDVNF